MITIIEKNADGALVDPGMDHPPLQVNFIPLDVSELSPEDAFIVGMSYSLVHNRGIPVTQPLPSDEVVPLTPEYPTEVI